MTSTTTDLNYLNATLDKLDVEDNDNVRADLIDLCISLADRDPECAKAWSDYR